MTLLVQHPNLGSASPMPEVGIQHQLPVLAPVADYEKIQRIGEGTYGVVCEPCPPSFIRLLQHLPIQRSSKSTS